MYLLVSHDDLMRSMLLMIAMFLATGASLLIIDSRFGSRDFSGSGSLWSMMSGFQRFVFGTLYGLSIVTFLIFVLYSILYFRNLQYFS